MDLDYIDENAEKLARAKMKSEAMKRQFAINDYARTKKALDSCVSLLLYHFSRKC